MNSFKPKYYFPDLNQFTGSIHASIFCSQVCFWYHRMGKPFYKFDMPCNSDDYKEGDSWSEELKFTKAELRKSKENCAFLLKKGNTYDGANLPLVLYWKIDNNKTKYTPNLFRIYKEFGFEFLIKNFHTNKKHPYSKTFKEVESRFQKGFIDTSEFHFSPIRNPNLTFPYIQKQTKNNNQKETKFNKKNLISSINKKKEEETTINRHGKKTMSNSKIKSKNLDFDELFPKNAD